MKKIRIIILIGISFFMKYNICYAETFKVGNYIDNAYIKKEKGSLNHYLHSQFIYKEDDNNFVYCIDPFDKLSTEDEYDEHDTKFTKYSRLDEDTWNDVVAAAYFGYMYEDHTDPIWYSITQVVIWRIVEPDADIYFTDRANGNKIHDYDGEIKELINLINDYYDTSELPDKEVLKYNESKYFDLNDTYKSNKNDNHVNWQNGRLLLVANFVGTLDYSLYKGNEDYAMLYTHDVAQNLIWVYDKPYVEKDFSFTSLGGRITVNLNREKKYYSTCQDNTKTIYGLYDSNDHLLMEIDGTSRISNMLSYGKYYVKQISHGCDYQEDDNKYEVELNKESISITIDVKQKYKTLHLTHNICSNNKCIAEEDVSFSFASYKNEYFNEVMKTDNNGKIDINLGNSIYLINQIDGNSYYSFSNDVLIDLSKYEEDDVYITLNGYLTKADIKVYVTDINNNPIDDVLVCLYNEKLIDCMKTINGELIFKEQELGKYIIKEEEINEKFILNNEEFKINVYDDVLLKIVNNEYKIAKPNNKTIKKEILKKVNSYKDEVIPSNNNTIENPNTNDLNVNFIVIIISLSMFLLKKINKCS